MAFGMMGTGVGGYYAGTRSSDEKMLVLKCCIKSSRVISMEQGGLSVKEIFHT